MDCTKLALSVAAALLAACTASSAGETGPGSADGPFERIATFAVHRNTDIESHSVAEILSATADGLIVVYTDSEGGRLGFLDITDPHNPAPAGTVAIGGEPTSVAVHGRHALVVINTSESFVDVSGELAIVDVDTHEIVRVIPLGGQPDSVAVSPDGRYAAIAVENERDEHHAGGALPQMPAGYLVIVDLVGAPAEWTTRTVELTGVTDVHGDDPEPEFVDINASNVVALTLQENNHIALIDLASGEVLTEFSTGTVDLAGVDVKANGEIDQTGDAGTIRREPDAITWLSSSTLASAGEGDLVGGSRGFTTWADDGSVLYAPGNALESALVRIGHYPEYRSALRGGEPEGIEYGAYGDARYLFVCSERGCVVFVFRLDGAAGEGERQPKLTQILPTGVGPEGVLAIPGRDLLVVASEVDIREAKIRSTIMIYERNKKDSYPEIESVDRAGKGIPIPWGALSGLAVSPTSDTTLYSVHDDAFRRSHVFEIDRSTTPATLLRALPLQDTNGLLRATLEGGDVLPEGAAPIDVARVLRGKNKNKIALDLEGVAVEQDGTTLWVVSEGRGNLKGGVSDADKEPFKSPNLLLRLQPNSEGDALVIVDVVTLPAELNANQFHAGLEGVTVGQGGIIHVCFQRAWRKAGDPKRTARIGRFDPKDRTWTFALYALDKATSPNGGRTVLSGMTTLKDGRLALLERDNQAATDATIKRVYAVDPTSVTFSEHGAELETLEKALVVDVIAAGAFDALGLLPFEKLEGLTALANGELLIVNDNDAADGTSGETRILALRGVENK